MKYIELNTFLKIQALASSGGAAKQLIRSGAVQVNGTPETRNKRKLIAGDKVTVQDKTFTVEESVCQKETTANTE